MLSFWRSTTCFCKIYFLFFSILCHGIELNCCSLGYQGVVSKPMLNLLALALTFNCTWKHSKQDDWQVTVAAFLLNHIISQFDFLKINVLNGNRAIKKKKPHVFWLNVLSRGWDGLKLVHFAKVHRKHLFCIRRVTWSTTRCCRCCKPWRKRQQEVAYFYWLTAWTNVFT